MSFFDRSIVASLRPLYRGESPVHDLMCRLLPDVTHWVPAPARLGF
jgi:hypothetical protein